jgi:UDP-N-acetylmuramate--alanine ligase
MRNETDRDEAGVAIGPRYAHLVGLGGRGMSGIAQVLAQSGLLVSGSDVAAGPEFDGLRRLGVRVHEGHAPGHLPRRPHFLVYDVGKGREHPERLAALRAGSTQSSRGEILKQLIAGKRAVSVSGGRCAGLAGAMLAWILSHAGLDPTIVLATRSMQIGGWGRLGKGPNAVVETVGEPGEIEHLSPWLALLMIPATDPAVSTAWHRSVEVSADSARGGVLVSGAIDLDEVRARSFSPVEKVGMSRLDDWWGADLREERGRFRFRAFYQGTFVTEVRLRVPGTVPVLCAMAALAAGMRLDVPAASIREALEEFAGVSRGFESRGSYRGVTLVDDEAQDPTSVDETLCVGRMIYGRRRLWAVLGPGRSPTEMAESFVAPLSRADRVLVVGAGGCDKEQGPWTSAVRSLDELGVSAVSVANRDEAVDRLDRQLEPGDVLITLGSGQVGTIADAFLGRLPRDRQAG